MFISRLSTELDLKVASFIESTEDLIALSQASKYYQGIGEETLYPRINVARTNWVGLHRLLLTLIKRPGLALLIKHIDMRSESFDTPDDVVSTSDSDKKVRNLRKETWDNIGVIRDRIDQVMQYAPQDDVTTRIKHSILSALLHCSKLARDSTDALIICVAKNLETLSVCQASEMTQAVLTLPWTMEEDRPFGKVKEILVCSCGTHCPLPLAVLPTTQCLTIQHWQSEWTLTTHSKSIKQPVRFPVSKPEKPLLRILRLEGIMLEPAYVTRTIQSPWCAELQSLEVSNVYPTHRNTLGSNSHGAGDMPTLLQSLEKHTPKLEKLVWTYRFRIPTEDEKIKSFRGLKCLKDLEITCDVVTDMETFETTLASLRNIMPDGLEALTFGNVPLAGIEGFVTESFPNPKVLAEGTVHQESAQAIKYLAAAIPGKRLHLRIVLEQANDDESDGIELLEISPDTIWTLRFVVDELMKLGLTLEIFREVGLYEAKPKLLIGPGFTAPTPHSVRPSV